MNKCIISLTEIEDIPIHMNDYQQSFLRLLKTKGAPMVGNIFLRLDPNYIFTRELDMSTSSEVFTWKYNETV